jgi:site-specific DNA-methyltransferase (adenine-specific)
MGSNRQSSLIHQGDVLEVLRSFADNTFHAIFSDAPYGLGFMGKAWDHAVPGPEVWAEALRVCRPGAHILVFGGTRTWHWLAVGLEQAGWEIRDTLMFLHGKGFPKSLNVELAVDRLSGGIPKKIGERKLTGTARIKGGQGGATSGRTGEYYASKELRETLDLKAASTGIGQAWAGYGSALKPAFEPLILARKPLDGTVANTALKWGTGGINIDGCRIGTESRPRIVSRNEPGINALGDGLNGYFAKGETTEGRWPANLLLDEEAATLLDAENPACPSRFFYTSKVSTSERNAGLDDFPVLSGGEATDREDGSAGLDSPRAGAGRGGGNRNPHPTMKPIALTTYMAKLLLPPPHVEGRILVPYSGVGSEMIGCLKAGWSHVEGIEREEQYVAIAKARIAHHAPPDESVEQEAVEDERQAKLFG